MNLITKDMRHTYIFLLMTFITSSLVFSQEESINEIENIDEIIEMSLSENPSLELKKISTFSDEDGDGFPGIGETIMYSFKVTNIGDKTIENILVADDLLNIKGTPITLKPNESNDDTFSAVHIILESDMDRIDDIAKTAVVAGVNVENKFVINNVSDDLIELTDKLYYQQYFR